MEALLGVEMQSEGTLDRSRSSLNPSGVVWHLTDAQSLKLTHDDDRVAAQLCRRLDFVKNRNKFGPILPKLHSSAQNLMADQLVACLAQTISPDRATRQNGEIFSSASVVANFVSLKLIQAPPAHDGKVNASPFLAPSPS